jgi:hypothetical protein
MLKGLINSNFAWFQCNEGSSYCEDPPNYPVHAIQELLHTYPTQFHILLPSPQLSPASDGGDSAEHDAPIRPEGGNAVDGDPTDEDVETNEVS